MTKLLIRVSRPIGWGFIPSVILGGILYHTNTISITALIQILYFTFPYSLFLYGINDINDYESDIANPSKGSMYGAKISKKEFRLIEKAVMITGAGTIIMSLFTLNIVNIISSVFLVALGYYYSAYPLRIKTKPPIDSISNGFLYIVFPFLIGQSYFINTFSIPREIIFLAIMGVGLHAVASLRDYTYDKKAGDTTFATKYGKKAASLLFPIGIVSTIIFGDIDSKPLQIALWLTLGVFTWVAFRPEEKIVRLAGRFLPYIFYLSALGFFVGKIFNIS